MNVAVGYGGRQEIADAVRSLLYDHSTKGTTIEELAELLDVEHIADHLYTAGLPDPDLVIRTSGEQRLGGFLLWQSAHSEFYFCDAYWPEFPPGRFPPRPAVLQRPPPQVRRLASRRAAAPPRAGPSDRRAVGRRRCGPVRQLLRRAG